MSWKDLKNNKEIERKLTIKSIQLTITSSGRLQIFSFRELNIIFDICSEVNPTEPTRSGRPHEPMNRVSPVNAFNNQ